MLLSQGSGVELNSTPSRRAPSGRCHPGCVEALPQHRFFSSTLKQPNINAIPAFHSCPRLMFFMARSRPLWLLISRIPFFRSGAAKPPPLPSGVSDDNDDRIRYNPDDVLSSDEVTKCVLSGGRHSRRDDDHECFTSWALVKDFGLPTAHAAYAPTNASVKFNFRGPAIKIFGGTLMPGLSPQSGQGSITLDDKPVATVGFPFGNTASLVFSSGPLAQDVDHSLEIQFTQSPKAVIYIDSWDATSPASGSETDPSSNSDTFSSPSPTQPVSAPQPSPESSTTPAITTITSRSQAYTITLNSGYPDSISSHSDHVHNPSSFSGSLSIATYSPGSPPIETSAGMVGPASRRGTALTTAGVVLGIIVAVLALGLVLYWCWKRRQRRVRARMNLPPVEVKAAPSMIFSEFEPDEDPVSAVPASQRTSQVLVPYVVARPPSRTSKRTSLPYAFTRRLSSVASSHDPPVPRNPGISPYTFERVVPYPESTTDDSVSHMERDWDTFAPPVPDLPPGAKFISSATAPASVPPAQPVMFDLEGGSSNTILPTGSAADPALVRHITFTTKGRVLRVQNPDYRSNASTAGDHETVSLS
ncbi:hypothetical protein EXIGLDRAFT_743481 [Exidia glandulosa HHB12029]|uniref:Uncharacterized protein n=1 Tax=Exidia glandulosa HHB12029 TaxID=1314781 RepID=A0A165QK50_EXIGL|nr:hypothetical protein EXIGLDRAFT_743481 [Exidia glandulosa HHB12029]